MIFLKFCRCFWIHCTWRIWYIWYIMLDSFLFFLTCWAYRIGTWRLLRTVWSIITPPKTRRSRLLNPRENLVSCLSGPSINNSAWQYPLFACRGLLDFPRFNMSNNGRRAFSFAGPHTWNSLPVQLRTSASLPTLKRSLKTFLFEQITHLAHYDDSQLFNGLYKCTFQFQRLNTSSYTSRYPKYWFWSLKSEYSSCFG